MSDLTAIQNIIAGLTPHQTKRLEAIQTQVKVELARCFGDRLAPIMTDVLVQESTTNPDVLAALEGIRESLPQTPSDWRAFVQNLVRKNDLAQRNIAFSDEATKVKIRADELAKLRPDQRVSLSRSGKLDAILDERVAARLEEVQ
ncbi:hypothetical protein DS909_05600 [Phaeobacter gallaeciensis]|uniref:Uncharacterized protein n=1 Tax=Phaeobacter gallaeciensis TaxID=60890 RepID=A0A366X335_9RHOB|nr:hypothetical protein [Phaeobacter gallaeciensis]RBW58440.1 hypothetical protein DS909_05600 [Phaeobacter gallaeciensis]